MALGGRLKKEALSLSQKAIERLMSDEQRAMKIASAIGAVQKGKQRFEERQDDLLRALNFAAKGDLKSLGKKFSSLKRRLRQLDEKLGALGGK